MQSIQSSNSNIDPIVKEIQFIPKHSFIHLIASNTEIESTLNSVNVQPLTNKVMPGSKLLVAGDNDLLGFAEPLTTYCDISVPNVIDIVSGSGCILALTTNGDVFGRGMNEHGELALGDELERISWAGIATLTKSVKQVALKADHSMFVTFDGTLYTCGANQYGQLV